MSTLAEAAAAVEREEQEAEKRATPLSSQDADYIAKMGRLEQEKRGKIRTFTGKYVNPLALDPALVCVEDIAHHLAAINRYTGATPTPYNVAQHSFLVASYFRSAAPRVRLASLFHDGSEYVLNDAASPVKHDPRWAFYRAAEEAAQEVIFGVWGIADLLPLTKTGGKIKAIDDIVFGRETASFWGTIGIRERIIPINATAAERLFLAEYRDIMRNFK